MHEPESMDELLFFTNRTIDTGRIKAWVFRPKCPKCGKGRLGKPINPKTKKVVKKAEYFECPECKFQQDINEAEQYLKVEVKYKCPHCGKEGETTTEYKRKTWQGVPAYVFSCNDCEKKIGITKKMKAPKKKK